MVTRQLSRVWLTALSVFIGCNPLLGNDPHSLAASGDQAEAVGGAASPSAGHAGAQAGNGALPVAASGGAGAAGVESTASASGGAADSAGLGGVSNAASGMSGGGVVLGGSAGVAQSAPGSSSGASGQPCTCSAPTPTCEAGQCITRGPAMVKVTSFYVDSTEVTAAQYAQFQQAKGKDTSGQRAECTWNTSFDPVFDLAAQTAAPNLPITNIDFCDAAAFCAWADKRLCGKIDGQGLTLSELAAQDSSQWFAACGGPEGQMYSYGSAYKSGACNDQTGSKQLLPVASKSQCEGHYPALFDLLGNAQEWVDACDKQTGRADGCEQIGGSYLQNEPCSGSNEARRDAYSLDVGFRCCSK